MASLSDASRLRLLRLLERHELGVAELCDVLQMPQSTVSRHLKVLVSQGWLVSRRLGTTHLYRMLLDELEQSARDLWVLSREQTEDWPTATQDEARLVRRLAEKQKDSKAFFAGLAAEWEQTRDELYGKAFPFDAVCAMLPSDWTVADLGCGTGHFATGLARFVQQVIAVDNSPDMLKAAKRQKAGNLDFRAGELHDLPIEDASCDAATMVLVLSYLDDAPACLAEMARILKPGGKAVIVDLLKHDRDDFRRQMGQQAAGFEPDELTQSLTRTGLSDARATLLTPEPGVTGPALILAHATKP